MTQRYLILFIFCFLTPPLWAAPTTEVARIVTRVVGETGDHFVTSREVQINNFIEQVLIGKGLGQKSYEILSGADKNFPTEVSSVLIEWVVYFEAKSFSATALAHGDVQKSMQKVEEAASSLAGWRALDVSSAELKEMVERKLTAKSFIRLKTESSLMPVTDAEAQAYFKKYRLKFGNMPFSAFRDNIKAFLIKQQTDRRLRDWLEVLQRKYKVRNFVAG
jgi:hypothetical protein